MTIYLCSWADTAGWESICDERMTSFYEGLEDYASPQGVVITDENEIPAYCQYVLKELKEWHKDMDEPLPECLWHFKGWTNPLQPTVKRQGIYELLKLGQPIKDAEPIALVVVREIVPWTSQ